MVQSPTRTCASRATRVAPGGAWRTWTRSLLVVATAVSGGGAEAQVTDLQDPRLEYLRLLQISGWETPASFTVLPTLPEHLIESGDRPHTWGPLPAPELLRIGTVEVAPVDARLRSFYNTTHPGGRGDGVVWQGKGLTAAIDLGTTLRWRWLTLELRPTVLYAQNESFRLAPAASGLPEVGYPWRRIDLPQRRGTGSYTRIDAGQSQISARWRGVEVGAGTKNLWWGPGRRNAIVMSDEAGGFPHAFFGTSGPADVGAGTIEARWIWGRLAQSDWFDPAVTRKDRFVTGAVAAWSPDFFAGLTVGVTRLAYGLVPESGVPLGDLFLVVPGVSGGDLVTPTNADGVADTDLMHSFFWRWVAPRQGLEFYGEWARNDAPASLTDLVLEPEHSQAYTLGLQKSVGLRNGDALSLWIELTHLEQARTAALRDSPTYYAHPVVEQGFTHDGQVIGAGVGPGGNAQMVGADLYRPWGLLGLYVGRDVVDNDAYYAYAEVNGLDRCCHNVELRGGVHALYLQGPMEWGGGAELKRELNRYFQSDESWNLNLSLSARYRPR